jgi:hypothetical protein
VRFPFRIYHLCEFNQFYTTTTPDSHLHILFVRAKAVVAIQKANFPLAAPAANESDCFRMVSSVQQNGFTAGNNADRCNPAARLVEPANRS